MSIKFKIFILLLIKYVIIKVIDICSINLFKEIISTVTFCFFKRIIYERQWRPLC